MKKDYYKKRFKKKKENSSLRLIRFSISVGIVPSISLLYKSLGRENEKGISQNEIKKKKINRY